MPSIAVLNFIAEVAVLLVVKFPACPQTAVAVVVVPGKKSTRLPPLSEI